MPKPKTKRGTELAQQGKTDEAIAQFQTAIAAYPDYAQAHNNLADALALQGNIDGAIVHYRQALEIDPKLCRRQSRVCSGCCIARTRCALPAGQSIHRRLAQASRANRLQCAAVTGKASRAGPRQDDETSMSKTCLITGGAGNLACQLTWRLASKFDHLLLVDLAARPVAATAPAARYVIGRRAR